MKVLVINGPNLNLLGIREPNIYGKKTLDDINLDLNNYSKSINIELFFFQSNSETDIIDRIHKALNEKIIYIIINPGAFTHTSIAIRDALLGVNIPYIEVHLSNIYSREKFRSKSFLSDKATGVITGLGSKGYFYALDYINNNLQKLNDIKLI